MAVPRLSIVIPSLASRHAELAELVAELGRQPRFDEVELVIGVDAGDKTTGAKRNELVARAQGDYVVHIDDDDRVSPEYIPRVLDAIDAWPPVDVILIRGVRTISHRHAFPRRPRHAMPFDFRMPGAGARDSVLEGRTFWQWPNHLCPVRALLAKETPFYEITRSEDIKYKRDLLPKLRTWRRANREHETLYFYNYSPSKRLPPGAR